MFVFSGRFLLSVEFLKDPVKYAFDKTPDFCDGLYQSYDCLPKKYHDLLSQVKKVGIVAIAIFTAYLSPQLFCVGVALRICFGQSAKYVIDNINSFLENPLSKKKLSIYQKTPKLNESENEHDLEVRHREERRQHNQERLTTLVKTKFAQFVLIATGYVTRPIVFPLFIIFSGANAADNFMVSTNPTNQYHREGEILHV